MTVLLLTKDLMTSSQVAAAASRCGVELQTVMSDEELLAKVSERRPDTVILDLSMAGIDVTKLVPELRALQPPTGRVTAFGPHVHAALLQQAKDAGCDKVLTRGQFHANIDRVLTEH